MYKKFEVEPDLANRATAAYFRTWPHLPKRPVTAVSGWKAYRQKTYIVVEGPDCGGEVGMLMTFMLRSNDGTLRHDPVCPDALMEAYYAQATLAAIEPLAQKVVEADYQNDDDVKELMRLFLCLPVGIERPETPFARQALQYFTNEEAA